jgi:hypothetical protein
MRHFYNVNAWGVANDYRFWLAFELVKLYVHANGVTSGASGSTADELSGEQIAAKAYAVVDALLALAESRGDIADPLEVGFVQPRKQ